MQPQSRHYLVGRRVAGPPGRRCKSTRWRADETVRHRRRGTLDTKPGNVTDECLRARPELSSGEVPRVKHAPRGAACGALRGAGLRVAPGRPWCRRNSPRGTRHHLNKGWSPGQATKRQIPAPGGIPASVPSGGFASCAGARRPAGSVQAGAVAIRISIRGSAMSAPGGGPSAMPRDEAGSTGIHLPVAHSFKRLDSGGRTDDHPIEMQVVHPSRNFALAEIGIERQAPINSPSSRCSGRERVSVPYRTA